MSTGNQQEIGSLADIAWLAGMMDGEGCVALMVFPRAKRQRSAGFRLQMRVTIANTNEGVTDRIIRIYRHLGIGHHVQTQISKSKSVPTGRIIRLVHVSTKSHLLLLLTTMLPHMAETEKIERATILVALIEQRDAAAREHGTRATHCYTKADVDLIMQFLKLTRSKQVAVLAEFLNEHTREARGTPWKKTRARHDVLWPDVRASEATEMIARHP